MLILKSLGKSIAVLLIALVGVILVGVMGFIPVYLFGLRGTIAWPIILLVLINFGFFYLRSKGSSNRL